MYSIQYAETELPMNFRRKESMLPARFPVTIVSATKTYRSLLKQVGANARLDHLGEWVSNRNQVDQQIIHDVINGTGKGILHEGDGVHYMNPEQVGGYPTMQQSSIYEDADHDGMADDWKNKHQFDLNDPSDNHSDPDGDGYTNIEEFLYGTDPHEAKT